MIHSVERQFFSTSMLDDRSLMPPPQSIAPAGLGSLVSTPESRHGRHRKLVIVYFAHTFPYF